MSWAALKAGWAQWRARARMRWGRISDDHLEVIEARRDLLLGQLQETQGLTPEQAENKLTEWEQGQSPPDESQLRSAR
jgi:uncharacterized protein YjbJ (UPF0337 family)